MHDTPSDAPYQLFVGIDIAAATATVAWQAPKQKPSQPLTIEQTPDGFSVLHQRLMKTGAAPVQTLVVLEATGVYWLSFATYFSRQGYAVSVVNPTQAHHFAKALLKRAKTNAIDAQTLSELASSVAPTRVVDASPSHLRGVGATLDANSMLCCWCKVNCVISFMRLDTCQWWAPRFANAWKP